MIKNVSRNTRFVEVSVNHEGQFLFFVTITVKSTLRDMFVVVSHKATNVSCKQWLGGTVPKVSKTANSDTLSLGQFLYRVSLENTNIQLC